MRLVGFLVVVLAMAWVPPDAAGGRVVYQWRDAAGVPQFADRPGAPDAVPVGRGNGVLSIVDTVKPAKRPLNPLVEREIRYQEQGARDQARAIEAARERRERHCAGLRRDLAGVEGRRANGNAAMEKRRLRIRELEDRIFSACR